MRVRLQRNSVLEAATYIKGVTSVVVFDDFDQPIGLFVLDPHDVGIRVLTKGDPQFNKEMSDRFGMETSITHVEVVEAPKR